MPRKGQGSLKLVTSFSDCDSEWAKKKKKNLLNFAQVSKAN